MEVLGARVRLMVREGCLPVERAKGWHGSMFMIVVVVGKSKQKNMCCLNATDMEKSEQDREE